MFENLTERLERSFKVLKGEGKITEINVAETLKEVRRALVEADVNYKIAKTFVDTVKEKAMGQNVLNAVKPKELMYKIVFDELKDLMGGDKAPLNLSGNPTVILMSGLQGSGKTTFSGKLAKYLASRQHKRPLLVAGDVYRPAAIEQLKVLADSIGMPVYTEEGNKDVVAIAKAGVAYAKANRHDLVIIDTAGRLAVDEEMMDEISRVKEAVKPQEILFVVDAMTGQDAVNTAKAFNDRLDFDGVILTKLDGDTRGGACLSIKAVTGKPVKFVGVGEKLTDLEPFYPDRMASRILGMGDVLTLIEKAQEVVSEEQAKALQKKMLENTFTLEDYLVQFESMKKMGGAQAVLAMMPGMGGKIKADDIDENKMERTRAIILSMTKKERIEPAIINASRKKRIAAGSGTSVQEINQLLKQFEQTKQVMKQLKSGKRRLPFG